MWEFTVSELMPFIRFNRCETGRIQISQDDKPVHMQTKQMKVLTWRDKEIQEVMVMRADGGVDVL